MATEKTASAPTDEATISLQRSLYDPGYVNAMSHFYRGELGRIMVWRQRLDITTNWAITSSTAIITPMVTMMRSAGGSGWVARCAGVSAKDVS